MRTFLTVALAISLATACVHPVPMTPQETCGVRGMVVAGISVSESNSSDVVIGNNGRSAVVTSSGYAEGVSCRPPQTEAERCDVEVGAAGAGPKADWQDVRGKRALVYLGVLAFILPGIIIGAIFSSNRGDAEVASVNAADDARFECGARQERKAERRKDVEQEATAKADRPRVIVEDDYPMICTLTKNVAGLDLGACFDNALSCDRFREIHVGSTPCRETTGAACYNSTTIVTGQRRPICFPTIAACEEVLAAERTSPDVTDLSDRCGIYRMRQP